MSGADSIERIRALLALYRESVYDVDLPDGGVAALRTGLPAPRQIIDWIGTFAYAAFMTACNPRSRSLTHEENEQRLEGLRRQVRKLGAEYLAGAGHIPGERWREASLLIRGLEMADIDALAREHGQNGILIVPAHGTAFLKIYRPDWQIALGSIAGVEWAASA